MAEKIKLTGDEIRFINFFEKATNASVKDCIINPKKGKITFIVNEGQAGIAIGKGGSNIKKMQNKLNKNIEVLEFSNDPLKSCENIFRPIQLKKSYISEKSDGIKTLYVSVGRGKLGMKKAKSRACRKLVKKYFNIDEVVIQ